jgi:NADH-quinone oxidoreductase subunit B
VEVDRRRIHEPGASGRPEDADPDSAAAPDGGRAEAGRRMTDEPIQMASDQPTNPEVALAGRGRDALAEPIIVENSLWRAANPQAYAGGAPSQITHLRELELMEKGDNGRWGALTIIPTKADLVLDLIRANSLWPLLSGLACCAIEMMSAATPMNDMDRFNMFPFRASPRQADVLIAAGTLTTKMAGPFLRLWEQMPEPKWCVAMGDCTTSGGRYKRSYSTVQGIDRIMPVDVYVPGCPPRPEGLIYGMLKLQQLILERRGHWAERAVGPTVPLGV